MTPLACLYITRCMRCRTYVGGGVVYWRGHEHERKLAITMAAQSVLECGEAV